MSLNRGLRWRVFAMCALLACLAAAVAFIGIGSSANASPTGTLIGISERDFHISATTAHVSAGDFVLRIHNNGPDQHELIIAPVHRGRLPGGSYDRTYGFGDLPLRSDGLTVDEEAIHNSELGLDRASAARRHGVPEAASGARALRPVLQHGGPLHVRDAHDSHGHPMIARGRHYRPFSHSGRWTVIAIFLTFGAVSALTVTLSIAATSRSKNQAVVVEVVSRQRTLAERYVEEVLLVRAGEKADPGRTGSILLQSTRALLNGGVAPQVDGDDDATRVPAASGAVVRHQLLQEARLVSDLTAYGSAAPGASIARARSGDRW